MLLLFLGAKRQHSVSHPPPPPEPDDRFPPQKKTVSGGRHKKVFGSILSLSLFSQQRKARCLEAKGREREGAFSTRGRRREEGKFCRPPLLTLPGEEAHSTLFFLPGFFGERTSLFFFQGWTRRRRRRRKQMVQFSSLFFSPFPFAEKKENGEEKVFSFLPPPRGDGGAQTVLSPLPLFRVRKKRDPFLVQADHIHTLHDTQNATKRLSRTEKGKESKGRSIFPGQFPRSFPPSRVLMMRPLSSLLRRGGLSRPLGFRARPPINAFFSSFLSKCNFICRIPSSNLFPFFFFPAAFFAFSVLFSSFCAKEEAAGGGRGPLLFPRKGKQEGEKGHAWTQTSASVASAEKRVYVLAKQQESCVTRTRRRKQLSPFFLGH